MEEPDSVEIREGSSGEEESVTREESQEELDRRAELDALFSNWEDSESTDTPASEISPEGLYSHLEQEGLLRLPITLEELIPSCAERSTLNPSFWGDWRTKKVRLVRDTSCTDRIKYTIDISELRDISGHPEAWISRVWDRHSVDPLVGFGRLLERWDGVYRAGLDDVKDQNISLGKQLSVILGALGDQRKVIRSVETTVEGAIATRPDVSKIFTTLEELRRQQSAQDIPKSLANLEEKMEAVQTQHKVLFQDQVGLISQAVREVTSQSVKESLATSSHTSPIDSGQSSFQGALEGLEGRLRGYVDKARETQVTVLQIHEEEKAERSARSLNLRINGLEESEDEDTSVVLFWNTRGLTEELIESERGLWEKMDIVAFVETWESSDERRLELDGLVRIVTLWNQKRFSLGRGFGGIVIWIRDDLKIEMESEFLDPLKQFACIRLTHKKVTAFLVVGYLAPSGASVYTSADLDPFVSITKLISQLRDEGPVWVMGDFNSRIRTAQSDVLPNEGEVVWRSDGMETDWGRTSDDDGRNAFTEHFLKFINTCELTVLNGTQRFPATHAFTCFTPTDSSVVDLCLASNDARTRVSSFILAPLSPESDHRPLLCNLSGFSAKDSRKQRREERSIWLDPNMRRPYEVEITA
ncbi:hypothetical protein R1sor_001102 [Riccia sorocarpa]|uniref:Endonuclease/exonuclease/phosphatase domain-containing protein n=1 Tax=Riccia sorocarpa TaxID=122646 RepID=A0ABD3GY91_9MARC